jgi:hypothetical protein
MVAITIWLSVLLAVGVAAVAGWGFVSESAARAAFPDWNDDITLILPVLRGPGHPSGLVRYSSSLSSGGDGGELLVLPRVQPRTVAGLVRGTVPSS